MMPGAEPPIWGEGSCLLLFRRRHTRTPLTTRRSGSLSVAFLCFNMGTGIMTPSLVVTVPLEVMSRLTVEVEGRGSADVFPSCSILTGVGLAARGLSAWLSTSSNVPFQGVHLGRLQGHQYGTQGTIAVLGPGKGVPEA